jgi:phosphohistidine phosphatase SixA
MRGPDRICAPRRAWLAFTAALLAFASALASAQESATLDGPALRTALRNGGYVLYLRHTSTDFGQNDDRMTGFEDCTTQRNLTPRGRDEARAIGAAIRRIGVPVDRVLASPFCRTRETAELIFGRATVDARVRGGPAQAGGSRYAELRTLLSTPVAAGANLAIVSHGNPFHALAGPPYLAEGEMAVVEPRGAEGFRIVAKVRLDGWSVL